MGFHPIIIHRWSTAASRYRSCRNISPIHPVRSQDPYLKITSKTFLDKSGV